MTSFVRLVKDIQNLLFPELCTTGKKIKTTTITTIKEMNETVPENFSIKLYVQNIEIRLQKINANIYIGYFEIKA